MSDDAKTVRAAARDKRPLDGADAQALEGALSMTERELSDARADVDRLTRELSTTRSRLAGARDALEAVERAVTPNVGGEIAARLVVTNVHAIVVDALATLAASPAPGPGGTEREILKPQAAAVPQPGEPVHNFAACIVNDGDKPCRDCAEYALDAVGAPREPVTLRPARELAHELICKARGTPWCREFFGGVGRLKLGENWEGAHGAECDDFTSQLEADRSTRSLGLDPVTIEACAKELEHYAFLMEQEERPGAKVWRRAAARIRALSPGAATREAT